MRFHVGTAVAALALTVAVTATPAAASATMPATPEANAVLAPGAAPAQWGGWSYPWGGGIPGPTGWAADPTAGAWGGSALWPSAASQPMAGPTMGSSTMDGQTMGGPMMGSSMMGSPTMGSPTMGGPMMGSSMMGGQSWGGQSLGVGLGGGRQQWWGGWALPWVATFGVNWWGAPLYPPFGGSLPPFGGIGVGGGGPTTVVIAQ